MNLKIKPYINLISKSIINDVEILEGYISTDHVNMFLSIPPQISVSEIIKAIKGMTSRKMLMEFDTLSRNFGVVIYGCADILLKVLEM